MCNRSTTVFVYDVRGREEEAYYCLKPTTNEVITCKTKLNEDDAEVSVTPISWIRTWQPHSLREYRFHSYVVKQSDPGFYYDIFSRSLSTELGLQNVIIEGALKTGPHNPEDGFFVRSEFEK